MRSPLLAAAALAALVLAGCSDPSSTSSNGGGAAPGPAQAKQPTCASAPASLVNSVLGTHFTDPEEQTIEAVVVCTYKGDHTMIVRVQTDTTADSFATEKQTFTASGQPTTDVAGFGDEAYSSSLSAAGITTNTLVTRKGSTEILVSSMLDLDQMKKLEEKLFTAF
jgi:ABC-type glycerol-3-phosphate transport system substrate-binding protein